MLKMKIIFHILVALTVLKQVSKFTKTFLVLIGVFGSIVVVVEGSIIPLSYNGQNADISTLELKFSSFKKGDGVGANKLLDKPIKSQNTSNTTTSTISTTTGATVSKERSLENECLLVCKLSQEKCGQIYKELGEDLNATWPLEKLEMCKVFNTYLKMEMRGPKILKYLIYNLLIKISTINTGLDTTTKGRATELDWTFISFPSKKPLTTTPLIGHSPSSEQITDLPTNTTIVKIAGTEKPSENVNPTLNIILPSLAASFVVLTLISFYLYKKRSKIGFSAHSPNPQDTIEKMIKFIETNIDDLNSNNQLHFIYKILKLDLQIKFAEADSLTKGRFLGNGHFGVVHEGIYKGERVALKFALKNDGQGSDPFFEIKKDEQLKVEIKTLMSIPPHRNIINYVGAFYLDGEKTLVMELCNESNLLDTLKSQVNHTMCECFSKSKNQSGYTKFKCEVEISKDILIKWSMEIASAMSHLSSKNILHIDLGAKNVLLAKDESGYAIRISDFGFAKKILDENHPYYTCILKYNELNIMPRPSAPDTEKNGKKYYTEKSDVWSYGLTLAEMFSIGDFNRCEKDFYDAISSFQSDNNTAEYQSYINKKLKEYPLISEDIYDIIVRCLGVAENRPKFSELLEEFTEMEKSIEKYEHSYQF